MPQESRPKKQWQLSGAQRYFTDLSRLSEELREYIEKGPPSVSVGLGSVEQTDLKPAFHKFEKTDAAKHEGRRVIVMGLPRMSDSKNFQKEVQELFHEFHVYVESLVFMLMPVLHYAREHVNTIMGPSASDQESLSSGSRKDCYVFVDFSSADEARNAAHEMNGVQAWGVVLSVDLAH